MRHLLNISDLNRVKIQNLLDRADQLLTSVVEQDGQLEVLSGQVITNLFFEPSTRTQYSFTIAAQRLGALVINPQMNQMSLLKGESLLDTLQTFVAMGTRLFVIRHSEEGLVGRLANDLKDQVVIINGGDGVNQHPTQALLDLLTIQQYKTEFQSLCVAIIGDIIHSRVAKSLIKGLQIMGVSQIRLIGPPEFLPKDPRESNIKMFSKITEGLNEVDVVVALRIQRERMQTTSFPDPMQFFNQYGLTTERLTYARPDAIVLHPGPINREIEIASSVADGPKAVFLQQIKNGVAMRMAILEWLLVK